MSVGHVARAVEEAGIPTTVIQVAAFRHVIEEMKLPRAVVTRHPMGRPLGPAGDHARHRFVVETALGLIDSADERAVIDLPGTFVPRGFADSAPRTEERRRRPD